MAKVIPIRRAVAGRLIGRLVRRASAAVAETSSYEQYSDGGLLLKPARNPYDRMMLLADRLWSLRDLESLDELETCLKQLRPHVEAEWRS